MEQRQHFVALYYSGQSLTGYALIWYHSEGHGSVYLSYNIKEGICLATSNIRPIIAHSILK